MTGKPQAIFSPLPTYQWQYSVDNGQTWQDYTGTGADTAEIFVTVTEELIGTMYRCVVTDGICEKITTSQIAEIKTPVEILQQPQDAFAVIGNECNITVNAAGKGLRYQWFVKNLEDDAFVESDITEATYTIVMEQGIDGREVYCVITDQYGNSVKTDVVTLNNTR